MKWSGAEWGGAGQGGAEQWQKNYPPAPPNAGVSPPLSRRRLLALGGAVGTTALAGCFDALDGSERAVCSSGYRRIDETVAAHSVVDYLRYASLTVPRTVPAGGAFVAELVNDSAEPLATLGRPRYAIQRLGDDGAWRNTVGVREDYEWPTSERVLAPGESLRWEMELSAYDFWGPFQRCTTHTPATYRFVYWGFSDRDAGVALAAPFEVVE